MTYLHVNSPDVVHEILDGEVVIVDLAQGLYFSVTQSGAWLWDCLAGGQPVEAVLQTFGDAYPSIASAREDGEAFIGSLREKGLMVESEQAPADSSASALSAPADYTAPRVEVFSDMAELLLLDPIHDVDQEQGWPVKKA